MCGNTLSFLYGKLSQIHIYHVLLNTCMEILFVRSLLVIQLPLYDSYLNSFYSYSYSYSQSYSYYSCNKMKHLKLKNHWYQSYETERIARPMSLDDKLCTWQLKGISHVHRPWWGLSDYLYNNETKSLSILCHQGPKVKKLFFWFIAHSSWRNRVRTMKFNA